MVALKRTACTMATRPGPGILRVRCPAPAHSTYQANWLTLQIGNRSYGLSKYRIYDPELGVFLSRDWLPSLNKYIGFDNNPVHNVDATGLYNASGHFYTTYIVARAAGFSHEEAFKLAYYSQLPDVLTAYDAAYGEEELILDEFKIARENGWERLRGKALWQPMIQEALHFLVDLEDEEIECARKTIQEILSGKNPNVKIQNDWQAGFLVHLFGDSFAHTRQKSWWEAKGERGWPGPLGHGSPSNLPDPHSTDDINYEGGTAGYKDKDFNRKKYDRYVYALFDALKDRAEASYSVSKFVGPTLVPALPIHDLKEVVDQIPSGKSKTRGPKKLKKYIFETYGVEAGVKDDFKGFAPEKIENKSPQELEKEYKAYVQRFPTPGPAEVMQFLELLKKEVICKCRKKK